MRLLLEVIGNHFPAVERDLIVANYHIRDIGTPKLSWAELESFVMAAPPNTAIHTSRTESWNKDAQMADLLARGYKPPQGGAGARGQQQRTMTARDGRARNLHNPADNPNRQVKQLMAGATRMTPEQFKARKAADAEAYYQLHPDQRPASHNGDGA